jgi:hypothetical protein
MNDLRRRGQLTRFRTYRISAPEITKHDNAIRVSEATDSQRRPAPWGIKSVAKKWLKKSIGQHPE